MRTSRYLAVVLAASVAEGALAAGGPLVDAAVSGGFEALAAAEAERVRPMLAGVSAREPADLSGIVEPAALRAWAGHLGRIGRPLNEAEVEALRQIGAHRSLRVMLGLALTEQDDPAGVLAVVGQVAASRAGALADFPDLVTALAVVWDSPSAADQSPEARLAAAEAVLDHLLTRRQRLRQDVADLPWPLAVFVVNSSVSGEERQWALEEYRLPVEPGRAFFDVRYDKEAYRTGAFAGGATEPYTLANIRRLGGVCKDQAHFAAEVLRAHGIPAAVCVGKTARGGGFHAWVGLVRRDGGAWRWDFESGRYSSMGFWSGQVTDPQSGRLLDDRAVAMRAEWGRAEVADREVSLALTACLDLVEPEGRLPLLGRAIRHAPANRRAWDLLADQCGGPDASTAQRREVAEVVSRFAMGRYDDFAFDMFVRLAGAYPVREQVAVLDRTGRLFPGRPDLQAELELHKADALAGAGRLDRAVAHYRRILPGYVDFPPLMLAAMERVDGLLGEGGREADRLRLFAAAFAKLKPPDRSAFAHLTPWFLIGQRYAQLLAEEGKVRAAEKVRAALEARQASAP